MKQVSSEVLYIKPGDTILLTFGKEYGLEEITTVGKLIADNFPDNKFIANIEGMLTDIKIIKEDEPFVTGLSMEGEPPSPDAWITSSWDPENGYKEFKFNDYLY